MKRNRKGLRLRTKLVWKEGEERKSSRPLELPGAKELKTTPLVFSGLLGVEETQLKIAPIPTTCLIVRGVAFPIHFALGFLAVSLNIFVRKNENHMLVANLAFIAFSYCSLVVCHECVWNERHIWTFFSR